MSTQNDAVFHDVVQGLCHGDFSRLEPSFSGQGARQPEIIEWHKEGRFRTESKALGEGLTCACFLGQIDVATYGVV